jgi:hypothetical protein
MWAAFLSKLPGELKSKRILKSEILACVQEVWEVDNLILDEWEDRLEMLDAPSQ